MRCRPLGRLEQLWPTFGNNRIRLLGDDRAPLIQRRRPASGQRGDGNDAESRTEDEPAPGFLESTRHQGESTDERRYRVIPVSQPVKCTGEIEEEEPSDRLDDQRDATTQPTDSAPNAGESTPNRPSRTS